MSKKKALKNQGLEFREDIYIGGGIEQEKMEHSSVFLSFPCPALLLLFFLFFKL